jgi:cell fate regulator YaaT (PSP1 superfamily)
MSEQIETASEVPPEPERAEPQGKHVVARYGRMSNLGLFRHHLDSPPRPGTMVVIRSERGTELGQVLLNVGDGPAPDFIAEQALADYIKASGADYPFSRSGRVLRPANAQDLNDQQHLDRSTSEEAGYCNDQIRQLELRMKLVAVEHLLGGERIVFYFTADHRVDFRELVKRMAGQYHTRIEMRQVGARDEARLVGDYERCGLRCCCQQYLKFLKPVSMRMAKTQKATLDPTKISGRCGRLMCCLRYEDATYEELSAALPRKNTWVRTADGKVGKVVEVQALTQLVRLLLANKSQLVVPNEEIAQRDVPEPVAPPEEAEPPPEPAWKPPRREPPEPRQAVPLAALDEVLEELAIPELEEPAEAESAAAPAEPPTRAEAPAPGGGQGAATRGRRSRRRRRRKKSPHPQALSAPPQAAAAKPSPPQPSGPPAQVAGRRGKRRRRRKKKSGGNRPGGPPPG